MRNYLYGLFMSGLVAWGIHRGEYAYAAFNFSLCLFTFLAMIVEKEQP